MATNEETAASKSSSNNEPRKKFEFDVPSKINDEYWIYSKKSAEYSREDDPEGGKWCVFVPKSVQRDGLTVHDHAWFAMEMASHKEGLFYKFKASTSLVEPHSQHKLDKRATGVIIVYTKDYEDTEDVKQTALNIQRVLRKFSFMDRLFLHYKTNYATEARLYPSQNIKGVSLYRNTFDGKFYIRKDGMWEFDSLNTERAPRLPQKPESECHEDNISLEKLNI